jgi:hypothetical protein
MVGTVVVEGGGGRWKVEARYFCNYIDLIERKRRETERETL